MYGRGRSTATPRGRGGPHGYSNHISNPAPDPSQLTFPTMSKKEIIQDMNSYGYPLSVDILKNPTPDDVKRLLLFFINEIYGKSLDDFSQPAFGCLDDLEHSELLENAVPLDGFFKQCRQMFQIAHYPDFTLADLYHPVAPRFMVQLSALVNLQKFRVPRLEFYEELLNESEEVAMKHKEISTVVAEQQEEKNKIDTMIAEDEPKVAEYKEEVSELTMKLTELREMQTKLTEDVKGLKKEIQQVVDKTESEKFTRNHVQGEVDELSMKVVQSPERVKNEIREKRDRLDVEKENLIAMGRRTRELQQRADSLMKIHEDLEALCKLTSESTVHMNEMKDVQNNIKALRASQLTSQAEIEQISHNLSYVDENQNEASRKRLARVEEQRNEFLTTFEEEKKQMMEENEEAEEEEEKARETAAELKKRQNETLRNIDEMKKEHLSSIQEVSQKQKSVAAAAQKFHSDMKESMQVIGDMNTHVFQELTNICSTP